MSGCVLLRGTIYDNIEQLANACKKASEVENGIKAEVADEVMDVLDETLKHIRSTPANVVEIVKGFAGKDVNMDTVADAASMAVKQTTAPDSWDCPNCGQVTNGEIMSQEEVLGELRNIVYCCEQAMNEHVTKNRAAERQVIMTLKGAVKLLERTTWDVEQTAKDLMELGVSWDMANIAAIRAVRESRQAKGEFICPFCGEMIRI